MKSELKKHLLFWHKDQWQVLLKPGDRGELRMLLAFAAVLDQGHAAGMTEP